MAGVQCICYTKILINEYTSPNTIVELAVKVIPVDAAVKLSIATFISGRS
jgi:hypothetical protein